MPYCRHNGGEVSDMTVQQAVQAAYLKENKEMQLNQNGLCFVLRFIHDKYVRFEMLELIWRLIHCGIVDMAEIKKEAGQ